MDQNEMSNLYRGPSIDASYKVSLHFAEGFQRRRLKCEKLTDDRQKLTPYNQEENKAMTHSHITKKKIKP